LWLAGTRCSRRASIFQDVISVGYGTRGTCLR